MHDNSGKPVANSTRLVQLACIVLLFHVAHSLLQEQVFHLPGFNHALLLSLLQSFVIAMFAAIDYVRQGSAERRTPLKFYVALSVLALIASFATNEASLRLNYPTQVIFKSSKLLAVMALRSITMQHRGGKLTAMDVASALAVVVGLCAFTFATHLSKHHHSSSSHFHRSGDHQHQSLTTLLLGGEHEQQQQHLSPSTTMSSTSLLLNSRSRDEQQHASSFLLGVVAVVVAVAADAALYIVEEKYCFHTFGSTSGEIIVFMNAFAAANAGAALLVSGNLLPSIEYITATGVLVPLVIFYSLCNFLGTTAILSVINEFGSPSAIIVTNMRKVMTILGSFIVYPKPFTLLHGVGLLLVTGGVYAHEVSRKKKAAAASALNADQSSFAENAVPSAVSPNAASPGVMVMTPAVALMPDHTRSPSD